MTLPVVVDYPPPEPLIALLTISHAPIGERADRSPEMVLRAGEKVILPRDGVAYTAAQLSRGSRGGVVYVWATFGTKKECQKAALRVIAPHTEVFYVCVDEREARRLHPEAFF